MSAHMRKRHTKKMPNAICVKHAGVVYVFPRKIAEKYRVDDSSVDTDNLFLALNAEYTKPGALLKGIRIRENLTQVELAKLLKVTQSDISQMENGARGIGRSIAQRIEKLFDIHYRSFLS